MKRKNNYRGSDGDLVVVKFLTQNTPYECGREYAVTPAQAEKFLRQGLITFPIEDMIEEAVE